MRSLSQRVKAIATAIALLLTTLGVAVTVTIVDDQDDAGKPRKTVTIHVDGNDADAKRDDTIKVPAAAIDKAETSPELDAPLRGPDPTKAGVYEGPLAGQEFPGCRNRLVGNFSSRGGLAPKIIVWHQTVSHENGWASQDALTGLASRLSSGVSWHLLIGRSSGRCTYTVPLNLKAWHGGNANPFSVGIEVEAFGNEGSYVEGAGKAKLLAVTREIARREGIPLRRGKVDNCRPTRSGIVEHYDLGICGGGHVDVSSSTWQRNPGGGELAGWQTAGLIAELARRPAPAGASLLAGERRNVECLQRERRSAKRHGGWDKIAPAHLRNASRCKAGLKRSLAFYRAHPRPNAAVRAERRRQIARAVA